MIIDTSVLVAILTGEEDGPALLDVVLQAERPKMSTASWLESAIVLDSRSAPRRRRRLDDLMTTLGIEVIPFDAEQAGVARLAYQDFGRGSGHPAQLNFGDCFAYALAVVSGELLLYKGDDFAATGVRSAVVG
ncbi:MAG: type II toxin-antitoxin system VapC family toxin [Microlunatus sp.]